MAEYLILIYEDEAPYAAGDQATLEQVMKAHQDFGTTHGAALRGGNALQPTSTATSNGSQSSTLTTECSETVARCEKVPIMQRLP